MEEFPPLVRRARALARQQGFALTREEAGPGRPHPASQTSAVFWPSSQPGAPRAGSVNSAPVLE